MNNINKNTKRKMIKKLKLRKTANSISSNRFTKTKLRRKLKKYKR